MDETQTDDAAGPTVAVTLESEEWYVLTNWLRERENRLQYALRSKSDEWAFVHDLRRGVERQRDGDSEAADDPETAGVTETVALTDRQVRYLSSFLRKRARRLRFLPWRDRERRDVVHLRDHLHAAARATSATNRSETGEESNGADEEPNEAC
ncbi:hypothetical protein M0R88_11350 [Halorussus gelatinilyticus]|uniref:Uncharacterized protein n=1 Tax=Halorussus gelatinilyticus TaxID=2937524 RepID=A0A8U0IFX5_9EURY|nr:hypothetical protein [Halorussus gelatinilyticus]UPV99121.1 hypothetical protein M0R88_11350 [Halorussus gelatinilyticus]